MPSAIKYVPPTDAQRDTFTSSVMLERMRRNQQYQQALKYYNGRHPEQLETEDDEPDDNVYVNLTRMAADRTAGFLFPQVPRIETDPESVEDTEDEIWIKELLEVNGGLAFLHKWVLRGFLAGHTFIRVKKAEGRKKFPSLTILDPMAVTTFWKADDVSDVLWYENRYYVGDAIYIEDHVWVPDAGLQGEWHIYTYRSLTASDAAYTQIPTPVASGLEDFYTSSMRSVPGAFDLYGLYRGGNSFVLVKTPEGNDFAIHGSDLAPIQETPHLPHPDDYYGAAEITDFNLQDTINRIWSQINRIARENSDPTDVITGASVEDVQDGGNIMTIGNVGAKVTRLEMKSDLGAAIETVDKLQQTFLAILRVVLLRGEVADLQRVTNASVQTLFLDQLTKNAVLQSSYGRTLKHIVILARQMAGMVNEIKPSIKFPSPLPLDLTEVANINAIQNTMGARSARTAATLVGDDWAFEQAALAAERELKMQQMEEEAALNQKMGMNPDGSMPNPEPEQGEKKPVSKPNKPK